MKKRKQTKSCFVRLCVAGAIVLFLSGACYGKPVTGKHREMVQKLIGFMNKILPGGEFKADLDKCTVKPLNENRFLVTFNAPSFTTDLTWIPKAINKSFPIKMDDVSKTDIGAVRFAEIRLIYDYAKKHIDSSFLIGMSIVSDFPAGGGVKVSIEEIILRNPTGSGRIKSGQKGFITAMFNPVSELLQFPDFTVKNIKIEISSITKNQEKLSVSLGIEEFGGLKEKGPEAPEVSTYIFKPDAPRPDLSRILQKGLSVINFGASVERVRFAVKKNGSLLMDGILESAFFDLFIKPNHNRCVFKLGSNTGFKSLRLSFPGKRQVEALSSIKDFMYTFSIEPVPPSAIMALIDMVKQGYNVRDLAENRPGLQGPGFQVMKFWAEIMKSKPLITFSLSPFKHYFGELSARADIRPHGLLVRPDVEISLTLRNAEEVLKKLNKSGVFSPSTLMGIAAAINMYMVKKENGDAEMTIVMKSDQSGKMFLNGIPMPIPAR